jgi:hypothetical protein
MNKQYCIQEVLGFDLGRALPTLTDFFNHLPQPFQANSMTEPQLGHYHFLPIHQSIY